MQSGQQVDVVRKYDTGNTQRQGPGASAARIADSDEIIKAKTMSHDAAMRIQQARQAKGWTQKELATKINEKPQVISDFESKRAVPTQQQYARLERVLGVKLRGKL